MGSSESIAGKVAELIREAFDSYTIEFLEITRKAKIRFEKKEWKGGYKDTVHRSELYDRTLARVSFEINQIINKHGNARNILIAAKQNFEDLIARRHDFELAETFFNSVTRKLLSTVGIDREVEFFHLEDPPPVVLPLEPIFNRYVHEKSTTELIRKIILDFKFKVEYEDIVRDSEFVARELNLYLWPIIHNDNSFVIEVIKTPFFRNKAAYLVGRIQADSHYFPFVLPLYNGDSGIYVDTVLLDEADVSVVFGFAHSYFRVEFSRHDALIDFIKSILPKKPVAELYISIGYNRHGKTEFYRDLHRFVHTSKEQFVIAPGKEGSVMIAFTLPDYGAIFKIIKDRPCFIRTDDITTKSIERSEVINQYNFVCKRDRVGRIVDTQEFENLKFKKKRFSKELLKEFRIAAKEAVSFEDEYVIIRHAYLQRKVVPLPIFLDEEKDPEMIRNIVLDFGYFFKDLTATGIFLCDLFNNWNYGVTKRGKVVLYDYDDVIPLEDANFRIKPWSRDEYNDMRGDEEWISSAPYDFFIDEIDHFLGIPYLLKGIFKSVHGDLFTLEFWLNMTKRFRAGEIVDITPYDRRKRFRNIRIDNN